MADFTIELAGEQFRRAYLIYIVEIRHNKDRYYYIGQTGDNVYLTARPAFRRLSGHLEDRGNSTQNQIYRFLAAKILGYDAANIRKNFSEEIKQAVEDFLVDSTLFMHIYKVRPFDPQISRPEHLLNVSKVSLLERYVIKAFADSGKAIINKLTVKPSGTCPYLKLLNSIKLEFDL